MAQPIPAGLEATLIPYLMIDGAADAISFYEAAFGATVVSKLEMPDGAIAHAEIKVHGAPVYLADAPDEMEGDAANPGKLGGSSVLLHQYVENVDVSVEAAVSAGATLTRPPADQFYGDRAAMVTDPFGHLWSLHTHIRDVSEEEMAAAMNPET